MLSGGAPNGGFEQGLAGWTSWGGSTGTTLNLITDSTRAHSGNNYLQLYAPAGGTVAIANSDVISVTPGRQITFGGWAYLESGTAPSLGWVLMVENANNNVIAYVGIPILPGSAWTYESAPYTIPPNGAKVILYCQIYQAYTPTTLRLDDAFISTGTNYYVEDMLGSSRVITTGAGVVCYDADFYPFGGERPYTTSCPQNYKFTGKERDSESGLDDFDARYYSSSIGRFMTPDWAGKPTAVPYASFGNPQSLNLYSYVNNNPTTTVDPDGHCPDGICENISALTPEQVDQRASYNTQAGIGVLKGVINFATSSMNAFITMGESTSGPIPQMSPSNDAQAVGMMVGTVGMGVASLGAEAPVASTIEQNAARGSAFEQSVKYSLQSQQTGVVEQLTVKTESGVKTRIDFAGKEAGKTALTEAKSSATAPLTKAQTKAFPEIQKSGCTVCGNGKPGFPGGTKIPPTKVKIVRPN